jgi:hypothetical protein
LHPSFSSSTTCNNIHSIVFFHFIIHRAHFGGAPRSGASSILDNRVWRQIVFGRAQRPLHTIFASFLLDRTLRKRYAHVDNSGGVLVGYARTTPVDVWRPFSNPQNSDVLIGHVQRPLCTICASSLHDRTLQERFVLMDSRGWVVVGSARTTPVVAQHAFPARRNYDFMRCTHARAASSPRSCSTFPQSSNTISNSFYRMVVSTRFELLVLVVHLHTLPMLHGFPSFVIRRRSSPARTAHRSIDLLHTFSHP